MKQLSRGVRLAIIAAGSATLVAASGLIVWRVLGPSEVVTPATRALPGPVTPGAGAIGAIISAPLVVDDRLRVYATQRQVWADASPDRRYETSAFWSYRRWPAEVVGVAAVPGTDSAGGQPIIITVWSDGEITALDGSTGQVAWRAKSQAPGEQYVGRRTGADTVFRPAGLFTAMDSGHRAMVVVAGPTSTSWFDANDGSALGTAPTPVTADCHGTDFTAAGHYLVLDTCAGAIRSLPLAPDQPSLPDAGQGLTSVEPLGCADGHSRCTGLRTLKPAGADAWLLTESGAVRSTPLAAAGAVLVDGSAVSAPNPAAVTELTARDPRTGESRWTWTPPEGRSGDQPAIIVGAGGDRILLLTPDRTLIAVSAETGKELSRASLILPLEPDLPYEVRQLHQSNRYVVLERTTPGVPESVNDSQYYFTPRPILLAGS